MNLKPVAFVVRHAVATAVLVGAATSFVTLLYFALLAWAIVTNGGLGGLLALPGMVVFVFLMSLVSAAMLLFPATSAAEVFRSHFKKSRFIEIPISSLLVLIAIAAVFIAASAARGWESVAAARGALFLGAVELVFLGIYWWSLKATALLLNLASRLWSAIRGPARSANRAAG